MEEVKCGSAVVYESCGLLVLRCWGAPVWLNLSMCELRGVAVAVCGGVTVWKSYNRGV